MTFLNFKQKNTEYKQTIRKCSRSTVDPIVDTWIKYLLQVTLSLSDCACTALREKIEMENAFLPKRESSRGSYFPESFNWATNCMKRTLELPNGIGFSFKPIWLRMTTLRWSKTKSSWLNLSRYWIFVPWFSVLF